MFGDRAVAFLDDHAGAGSTRPPFFLYLPVTAPHFGGTVQTDPVSLTQLPIGREREYLSRFDHPSLGGLLGRDATPPLRVLPATNSEAGGGSPGVLQFQPRRGFHSFGGIPRCVSRLSAVTS